MGVEKRAEDKDFKMRGANWVKRWALKKGRGAETPIQTMAYFSY